MQPAGEGRRWTNAIGKAKFTLGLYICLCSLMPFSFWQFKKDSYQDFLASVFEPL